MISCIATDVKHILHSKLSILVCYVNLCFVLVNFLSNLKTNGARTYVSQMYEIPKLLILSEWSTYGYFYLILFPLLVVLPTHSLFIQDRKSGINSYIISRTNHMRYAWLRYVSVFFSTFILFIVPFLIELGLSAICLECTANGDPSNLPYYETSQLTGSYPLSALYEWNKFGYALVWILLFGVFSGCCAVFNLAIATGLHLKYGIFAMLPLYAVLNLIYKTGSSATGTSNYMFFLRMFNSGSNIQYWIIALAMVFVMFVSLSLFFWQVRRK